MSPRTRWRVLVYGPAVLLATLTAPSLALGGSWWAASIVWLAALCMASQARSFRSRYKTGWHDGRVDLVREMTHDPDYHPSPQAPEPWTPRPPITVGIHHHHHDTDPDA